jgi:ABC-type transporter Mla MlaB component
MLRIAEAIDERGTTLRLEGKVAGQWVAALRALCDQISRPRGRCLTLDLADVTFIDGPGLALMQDLVEREVALVNCSPFTTEQLKEIVRENGKAL